jgi:hypothetical protein
MSEIKGLIQNPKMWLVKTEYFKIWHMISTALKIEELIYQI